MEPASIGYDLAPETVDRATADFAPLNRMRCVATGFAPGKKLGYHLSASSGFGP
jgi:hypothetical protein